MGSTLLYGLVHTDAGYGTLAARLTLGICMLPHGLDKLRKFGEMMDMFTQGMGIPAPFAFLVILAESFGALGLLLGVISRFCAFGTGLVMVGAILMVHGKNGFQLVNSQDPSKIGYEYNLALIGLSVAVMIAGGGALSFDRWLTKRLQQPKSA